MLLLCPGPVNNKYSKNILNNYGHRTIYSKNIYKNIEKNILELCNSDLNLYKLIILNGSGTSGIEMIISNYCYDKNVLILSNGGFGNKWIDLFNIYNINNTKLVFDDIFNFIEIENIIKKKIDRNKIIFLFVFIWRYLSFLIKKDIR